MLYDQGQLANVYLDSFAITKDVFYSSIARDIFDYLRRDMIGPEGEIFSAEDADSAESEVATRKKEGAFYVWTSKEVIYLFFLLGLPDVFINVSTVWFSVLNFGSREDYTSSLLYQLSFQKLLRCCLILKHVNGEK